MINTPISLDTFKHIISEHKKFISDIYKDSQNYNSFIITVGYAAFFTILSSTKDYLTKNEILLTSIFIAISVALFVLWEIGKMVYVSIFQLKYSYSIHNNPSTFIQKQKELSDKIFELNKKIIPLWVTVLAITFSTGFIAMIIMFISLIKHIK